jgi:microcystin-dependent protein
MPVPYLFATTPGNGNIPLANLDANFAYILNSPNLNSLIVSGTTYLQGALVFGNQTIPSVTGTNLMVLNTNPTLVAPNLGTPTYLNLGNAINLPLGSITGLAAGIQPFLVNPTSGNLRAAVVDETGTGALVFGTSPQLNTPTIASPTVSAGTFASPNLSSAILGTPVSGNLANCTGYPLSSVTGFGPGVVQALQNTPNIAGGLVLYNGSAGNLTVNQTTYVASGSGQVTVRATPNSGGSQTILWPAASGTVMLDSTVIGIAPGVVTYYAAQTPPPGWLLCDGQQYPTTTYPNLFAIIGYTFGGGGSLFSVPNLAGMFLRGYGGNSGAFGQIQQGQNLLHTHGVNDPGHTHGVNDPTHGHTYNDPGHLHDLTFSVPPGVGPYIIGGPGASVVQTNAIATSTTNITINNNATGVTNQSAFTAISIQNSGASENRPTNVALLAIIKY